MDKLTRAEIDTILEGMTARDIFAVIPQGEQLQGSKVAGDAFESAAARQGFGEGILDRVSPADAVYLASQLGEVFTADSPKGGDTETSPDSSDTGGSTPSY